MVYTTEQVLLHCISHKETDHQLLMEFVSGLYKDNTPQDFSSSLYKLPLPNLSKLEDLFGLILSFEPESQYAYRIALVEFLLDSQDKDVLARLEFIHTRCLFLFEEDIECLTNLRCHLFSYCFKMRYEALFDIQVYSVLYSILKDLNIPPDTWIKELDQCNIVGFWKDVYQCDLILENNRIQPYQYEKWAKQLKTIPEKSIQQLSIQIRFELYDTIYPLKLISYAFPDRISNLSDETKTLLKHTSQCPLLVEFETNVESLVLSLWNLDSSSSSSSSSNSIDAYSISNQLEQYNEPFKGITNINIVFRELCLMLSIAPLKFITQLTLCLLLVTTTVNVSNEHLEICQSAWLRGYTALLDQAQFQDPRVIPLEESIIIQALFKQASCFIMYQIHTKTPNQINLNPVWDHYDLQRRIYLKSIGYEYDESIIEKLLFTSILQ